MNNLNMDPSLNLIFKDHSLVPFDSTYIQPINIYGMELDLIVLFSFVHALFFFTCSSIFGIFWSVGYHVWDWPSWLGVFPGEHHESHFSYHGKFSGCLRAIWATLKCLRKDVEWVWSHDCLSYKLKAEALHRHREWECTSDLITTKKSVIL